jgi:2-polyprenyl-3-methyl-5-hydroxy-6-metoxy-1,4-benzoquinol methylase
MDRSEKWQRNLAKLRAEELEVVFEYLGGKRFPLGLELGAGNGFQSNILVNVCTKLIATDLNSDRLPSVQKDSRVEYEVVDAELVSSSFGKETFDFIYSSNLMEHIPNINLCLSGCHEVLKDNGLFINIIPNPSWRLLSSILYYPVKATRIFSNILSRIGLLSPVETHSTRRSRGNNIKVTRSKKSHFSKLLPPSHGVSSNSFVEFAAFSKVAWIKNFEQNDFQIVEILRGPISSGYGLGFVRLKKLLELVGFTTEYIYIVKKKS